MSFTKRMNDWETGRSAEKHFAKRVGGKLTKNSGAMKHDKGDVRTDAYMIEVKTTQANSITIERGWLTKVYDQAMLSQKRPALAIQFTTGDGRPRPSGGSWVMITESEFNSLMEMAQPKPDGP